MMVLKDSSDRIYPADRCTWVQSTPTDGRGYIITTALFFNGFEAGAAITGAELGYIGKSGRFVSITD